MSSPPGQYRRTFAAARMLRDVCRDVHGNLAALQVVATPPDDSDELAAIEAELASLTTRVAELRERSATLAQQTIDANIDRLKPGFGYVICSGREVTKVTTPGG